MTASAASFCHHMISILLLLLACTVQHAQSLSCKCSSNGTLSTLNNYAGGNRCQGGYCRPPGGTGCFRANVYNNNYQRYERYEFCGDAPRQSLTAFEESFPVGVEGLQFIMRRMLNNDRVSANYLGQCTSMNNYVQGICYCEDSDYCNGGISLLPSSLVVFLFPMVFSIFLSSNRLVKALTAVSIGD